MFLESPQTSLRDGGKVPKGLFTSLHWCVPHSCRVGAVVGASLDGLACPPRGFESCVCEVRLHLKQPAKIVRSMTLMRIMVRGGGGGGGGGARGRTWIGRGG